MRLLPRLALALSIGFLAAVPASAQSYRTILLQQMDAAESVVRGEGYRADPGAYPSDVVVGFLKGGGSVGLELTLQAGTPYMVVGVCDADCSDMDLALADVSGNILVQDEAEDDVPVLEFTAPPGGAAMLLVSMYACSVEPCAFAYKVYRR